MAVGSPPRADAGPDAGSYRLPLFLFGVGLGGFVDGIVLHQILQWHHMLSDTSDGPMDTVAGLERNTLADGLFHAFTFGAVVVALYLTLRIRRGRPSALAPSWAVIVGWLLIGWASFNLVEGVVDHHLLRIHHVRDDVADPLPWDLAFLAISAVLLGVGVALLKSSQSSPSSDLSASYRPRDRYPADRTGVGEADVGTAADR